MSSNYLNNNTIVVAKRSLLPKLIEKIRNESFLNIKFMTLDDLRNKCTFTYDEKSIYYLMDKYKYNYDVSIKLLNNLYYVSDDSYSDYKLNNLVSLKRELMDQNLLYFHSLFLNSLCNYKIIIYNYEVITKYDLKFIDYLKSITDVEFVELNKTENLNTTIYKFNNLEDEVSYVAEDIMKLIDNGININNIKICGINDEYINVVSRIFGLYNIPIMLDDSRLFGTRISNVFFKFLDKDINNTLNKLSEEIDLKNENNLIIYNSIINIINKYTWCNNYLDIKELLINDFKNTRINRIELDNEVSIICGLDEACDDDYVYLMSFNQEVIPKTYKDEDYLNDKLKKILGIDTSNDLNIYSSKKWVYDIRHTKNLTITYKENSYYGEYYLSSLNDILNYNIEFKSVSYSNYSNLYNELELAKKLDNLIKYGIYDDNISLLFNNYSKIKYLTYNNQFTGIPLDKFNKYLNNNLVLSYTSINNYYHCSFKYYLSNILKLDIYEESFSIIIGNLFHYILSICFNNEIDVRKEYYDYIDKLNYNFDDRELFFLDSLFDELLFIINTIKEHYNYTSFNKYFYEEKIEVVKSIDDIKIIFKGLIDKIMMDDEGRVAVIDYKTGSTDINLNNIIYGIDMQLPIYIYLLKNKFPNIRIVGFYLQRILNGEINIDNKHTFIDLKKDRLKLNGYTVMYEDDINKFDSSYTDSKVIKGMRTSSKGLYTKKVYDYDFIDNIYKLVNNKIDEVINNILQASFEINPKKIGMNNVGCKYCKYKDICFMKDDNLVNLREYKNTDFLKDF
ncbi:MAG: PD-(D/E)XK nuclease family protein [Bacilli bacterium]|nr:PD-(D/E)XK nuclease family protein [Bacilli bacterium]